MCIRNVALQYNYLSGIRYFVQLLPGRLRINRLDFFKELPDLVFTEQILNTYQLVKLFKCNIRMSLLNLLRVCGKLSYLVRFLHNRSLLSFQHKSKNHTKKDSQIPLIVFKQQRYNE